MTLSCKRYGHTFIWTYGIWAYGWGALEHCEKCGEERNFIRDVSNK